MILKKHTRLLFISILLILLLFISSTYATSKIKSIDVNNINLNSIDESKIENLKGVLNNIDFKNLDSASVVNSINKNEIVSGNINSINTNAINMDEVVSIYDKLSDVISNEEIADLIKDNSKILSDAGISKETLNASEKMLRTFNSDAVIDIMKNDLDLAKILEMYKSGASLTDIISSIITETPLQTKVKIVFKLLFSNTYIRIAIFVLILVGIYSIFITALIFEKAGKQKFITLIPIYRDIVHLKVCGLSPWLLLLVFIPILGWIILMSIAIIARFELAKHFGHGFFFGLGLLFIPTLFRSIIAFSNNEYMEDYEEEYE